MDIANSFENALDRVVGFLPNLIGFLIILLVGYIIAKVVSKVVDKLLQKVGVDRKLSESDGGKYVDAVLPGASPSAGVAKLVFWLIFVFFIVTAVGALELPAATAFMNDVLAYLPNVIVAVLIFLIAALVSSVAAAGATRMMGDTATGKVVASVVPALVMVIALFMILEQLQIAPEIIRIAFAAVMFAIALGLALAFGLGGRESAARLLQNAEQKGREHADQVKHDVEVGKQRAGDEADRARATAGAHASSNVSGQTGGQTGAGAPAAPTRENPSYGSTGTTPPGTVG